MGSSISASVSASVSASPSVSSSVSQSASVSSSPSSSPSESSSVSASPSASPSESSSVSASPSASPSESSSVSASPSASPSISSSVSSSVSSSRSSSVSASPSISSSVSVSVSSSVSASVSSSVSASPSSSPSAESIEHEYEISSEGAVRHWEVPYARLEDTTPTVTLPAAVTSLLPGTQLTGTILTIDDALSVAIIDFTCSMVYQHNVRNVLTYAPPAEASWGAINIGDPVYYDPTAPAGTQLSTSPLDNAGVANPLFGFAVSENDVDMALFPKGVGGVASTQVVGVMQIGAGAH